MTGFGRSEPAPRSGGDASSKSAAVANPAVLGARDKARSET